MLPYSRLCEKYIGNRNNGKKIIFFSTLTLFSNFDGNTYPPEWYPINSSKSRNYFLIIECINFPTLRRKTFPPFLRTTPPSPPLPTDFQLFRSVWRGRDINSLTPTFYAFSRRMGYFRNKLSNSLIGSRFHVVCYLIITRKGL